MPLFRNISISCILQSRHWRRVCYSVEDKEDDPYYLFNYAFDGYLYGPTSDGTPYIYYYPLKEANGGIAVQKFKTGTPKPKPTPTLTLGGQSISDDVYPYTKEQKGVKVVIAKITLSTNEVADWKINSLKFHGLGCGNEKEDIDNATLYLNSVNGEKLGTAKYNADNGTISFSVNKTIPASSSMIFVLEYEISEKTCPCKTFKIHIDMNDVSAEPLEYADLAKKLPTPPTGVDSGPITVKPGSIKIVSGNNQWGLKFKPLEEPFKVQIDKEYIPCVDYVQFEIKKGADYKAKLQTNNQLVSHITPDANGVAQETLILGDKSGKNYPYTVQAFITQKDHCTCDDQYKETVEFIAYAEGLEVTAQHDGNKNDEEFSTFISNIEAKNKFIATIPSKIASEAKIKEVRFEFAGETKIGEVVKPNEQYEATFDMAKANQSSNLKVTVISEDNTILDEVEVPVKAIDYPSWAKDISDFTKNFNNEFDDKNEKYIFSYEYPKKFQWQESIPEDVILLGGLNFFLPFDFKIVAEYNIDRTSSIEATAYKKFIFLDQEGEWKISFSGNFNQNFEFQKGTIKYYAKALFNLPEKGLSLSNSILSLAVDIGGNVEMLLDSTQELNNKLELENAVIKPEASMSEEIGASLNVALGLVKMAASIESNGQLKIKSSYTDKDGISTEWCGEVGITAKAVAGIFWKSIDISVTHTASFGNAKCAEVASISTASQEENPDLISTSSIAFDENGKIMQVWIGDTDNNTGSVNPDLFFRYDNGTSWTKPEPIIGDNSPNNYWETDPFVISIGNNKFLAAWTLNDGEKTLEDLNEILAHQDIVYSIWEGTKWSEPKNIIDDNEGDGSVSLCFDKKNNRVFAIWMHDKNSDNNLNTRDEWKLMYSIYDIDNDKWSEPQTIGFTEDESADFMPAVSCNDNGTVALVWVKDGDGKFFKELDNITNGTNVDYTNNDSNVMFSKFEDGSWSEPVALTKQDNMSDSEPFIKISNNGIAIAVWISKDGVKDKLYYSLWNGVNWLSPIKITESSQFIENPKIVMGKNIAITWTKNDLKSNKDYASEGLTDGINYKKLTKSSNVIGVIYRGYNGYDGEIYYTEYNQDNISWSEPDNLTGDNLTDWNVYASGDNNSVNIKYVQPETKLSVNKGWQIVSVPVEKSYETGEKFEESTTVWGWTGSNWEVWSSQESIINLLNKYKIKLLETLEPGKGYWLNSGNAFTESFEGVSYGKDKISLSSGWNLVGCGIKLNASDFSEAKTLWQWTGSRWKVWSSESAIVNLLNQYKIEIADEIKAGEGFWVNK